MVTSERLEAIYQGVVARNPGEVEFHQAAREVLESLAPVLVKYPEFLLGQAYIMLEITLL